MKPPQVKVGESKYLAALKFLMGHGAEPSLNSAEVRFLQSYRRGPFAEFMPTEQAEKVLKSAGWEKSKDATEIRRPRWPEDAD